jgi:tetratricopeptide (TPR) repeat protein
MPRSGHHVLEMMLGRLLGRQLYYCEFYSIPGCCHAIPCTRTAEFAAAGARVFIQKSHDHALKDDPAAPFDGIVVQVREPVARALSNYELDLETLRIEHSESYRRFWLGLEAAYTLGFAEKWCGPAPNRLLLRYEDLLADPVAYFRRVFDAFRLDRTLFDPDAVVEQQRTKAAGGRKPFRVRDIRGSTYFHEADLGAFQDLLAPALKGLPGYTPHKLASPRTRKPGSMALVFHAKRASFAGKLPEALQYYDRYLDQPDADPAGYLLRASVRRALGDLAGAEAGTHRFVELRPRDARGYRNLADIQFQRGDAGGGRESVRLGLANSSAPEIISDWALASAPDDETRAMAQRSVSGRELEPAEVIQAFRLILGRDPESDLVILQHQRIGSPEELRRELLRSQEFREKHAAALQGDPPNESEALGQDLTAEDVTESFRWLLGRNPESEATVAGHLGARTLGRLRLVLLRSPEFRRKLDALA